MRTSVPLENLRPTCSSVGCLMIAILLACSCGGDDQAGYEELDSIYDATAVDTDTDVNPTLVGIVGIDLVESLTLPIDTAEIRLRFSDEIAAVFSLKVIEDYGGRHRAIDIDYAVEGADLIIMFRQHLIAETWYDILGNLYHQDAGGTRFNTAIATL
jgi:hypothetical protein